MIIYYARFPSDLQRLAATSTCRVHALLRIDFPDDPRHVDVLMFLICS